ncbi:ABC transporter substrate-binding protein [Haliangium sp.]|uniref:ABC transporter substrate-binding protein n=1 Tax=Haliangium sp. TaxID=2663208 RepID=UPI003D0A07B7
MGHWKGEDKRETLVREVAKDFAFSHPGVKVELVFAEDIIGHKSHADTGKFIAKMIQSGTIEWDVIWLDHSIYTEISAELDDPGWGAKHLVDFGQFPDFMAAHKDFIAQDPSFRAAFGGVMVGPYLEGFVSALYYNRDVAAKVGVDVPASGMTYADLLAALKTLHEYNQSHGTDIRGLLDAHDRSMLGYVFDRLVKCELDDFDQVRTLEASADKLAALRKAFAAFEEMSQYQPLSAEHVQANWYDTRDLILDDKLLFYNDGTWMYSHWMTLGPDRIDKLVPVESVTFEPGCGHYIGGYIPTWGVLEGAPHRDLAVEFLRFWAAPRYAEKWVRYTKNPTGLRGNLSEPTLGDDPFERFQAEITKRYRHRLDNASLAAICLGESNRFLDPKLDVLMRETLLGQKSAQAAYDELLASARWTEENPRPRPN